MFYHGIFTLGVKFLVSHITSPILKKKQQHWLHRMLHNFHIYLRSHITTTSKTFDFKMLIFVYFRSHHPHREHLFELITPNRTFNVQVSRCKNVKRKQMSLCMRKPTIWCSYRMDTNWPVQSQKLVRDWKFWI